MGFEKTDMQGYDDLYQGTVSSLAQSASKEEYLSAYKLRNLSPFWKGGNTKGYVRGLAVQELFEAVRKRGVSPNDVTILDAGSGQGELSVYLALQGFSVIGVDISKEGVRAARKLANAVGVGEECIFLAESLDNLSIADESVDFVIGLASLHHFIKYTGVPSELGRVLKKGGEMFFADSFGENKAYHLFHNKERMRRLGDVILTRRLIYEFFEGFDVEIIPTDWFVMIDKLLLKIFPGTMEPSIRKLSRLWWKLDRMMPVNSATLFLAGAVMTHVSKRS